MSWTRAVGIAVCLSVVLFGVNETYLSSVDGGSDSAVIRVGDCRNPSFTSFGRRWTTSDVVPAEVQPGESIAGEFSFEGDLGEFVGAGDIVLTYRSGARPGSLSCVLS